VVLVDRPPVCGLAIFLVLAWRVAGYYGGDRYLLPLIGTPWTGSLAKQPRQKSTTTPSVPVMS
jgi:thiosulfate dehydrogenase [quinone] large subunit